MWLDLKRFDMQLCHRISAPNHICTVAFPSNDRNVGARRAEHTDKSQLENLRGSVMDDWMCTDLLISGGMPCLRLQPARSKPY